MKNHYHLLLSPINNDLKKLSLFMKKLNMGYARFFNEKYDRSGYLWQGKYKKISIKRDSHFNYIPYYIHLNPLDYTHPEWRDGKVTSQNSVHEELTKYRWSSFLDYCGKNNFPSILHKKLMTDTLGDQHNQLKEIDNIIRTQALATPSNQIEI